MYDIAFPNNSNRLDVDGGYLIRNVTILSVGVWNGLDYTSMELAKAANKWRDNTIWNRHYEGKQRDETNRIGHIKNQHFDGYGISGDVFLSNETVEGRDMIELVRTDKVTGISVEHVEEAIVDSKPTGIQFLGAAIVPEPACSVCQLSKKNEVDRMEQADFDKLSDTVAELAKSVDKLDKIDVNVEKIDKLSDTVAELAKAVEALGKVDVDNVVKEQSRKDVKVIEGLEKRIKELEDTPVAGTEVASDIVDSYANIVVDELGIRRMV